MLLKKHVVYEINIYDQYWDSEVKEQIMHDILSNETFAMTEITAKEGFVLHLFFLPTLPSSVDRLQYWINIA